MEQEQKRQAVVSLIKSSNEQSKELIVLQGQVRLAVRNQGKLTRTLKTFLTHFADVPEDMVKELDVINNQKGKDKEESIIASKDKTTASTEEELEKRLGIK